MPSVTFCTEPFQTLARSRLRALGLPELPVIFLPHPIMPRTPAEIEQLAAGHVAQVVQALTGGSAT